MADGHESAAAAWLDQPETQREVEVVMRRFPEASRWDATRFALLIEILASLSVYGGPNVGSSEDVGETDFEDDGEEEPWKLQ